MTSGSALIVPDGPALTKNQLDKTIVSFQKALSNLGLTEQAAVALALPNSVEFAVGFLGIIQSSFIACPLNPNYKQEEFEFYIEDTNCALLLLPKGGSANSPAAKAARKFGSGIAEVFWSEDGVILDVKDYGKLSRKSTGIVNPKDDTIAFMLHTSGTTGRPKAVPLLHRNLKASISNICKTYNLSSSDTGYLVMPLFHVHGLVAGFLSPLAAGGAIIVPKGFSARRFWPEFIKYGANWYTAVPTIHQILLSNDLPDPIPNIRFIRSCSSSLAPSVFHTLESKLNAPVLEAYAMTEACHQMTSNSLPPGIRKPGTVGVGHGVEVVILNDKNEKLGPNKQGEVSIRGPNVTSGYLNNPKANAESFTAGYFRTGDQGKFDDDGMLVLTGRIKELINRGGEKISPIELDGILLSHPKVSEAVVFGAPDKMYGQQVNAVVVPKTRVTEKELQDYVASKVAKFKVPVRIFFTDVMPKTATGKIQRRIIAQKFTSTKSKL